jgi:hypothetical protein
VETRYETWERLADEVELTTAQADSWTCFEEVSA